VLPDSKQATADFKIRHYERRRLCDLVGTLIHKSSAQDYEFWLGFDPTKSP
jgi:hypothetical protein